MELEKWVEKSNKKPECYYWLETKKDILSEIFNYEKIYKSPVSLEACISSMETEYVSIEKV